MTIAHSNDPENSPRHAVNVGRKVHGAPHVSVAKSFGACLLALSAAACGGTDNLQGTASEQGSARPAPMIDGLDCGDDSRTIVYTADYDLRDGGVGASTPREAVQKLRASRPLTVEDSPSQEYSRAEGGGRTDQDTGQKALEFQRAGTRGPQARVIAERLEGAWYATYFVACAAAVPTQGGAK